tara:strand:+ start:450 stop:557 length:108 start_codon:yes stop_codon:yes gene_type:complete
MEEKFKKLILYNSKLTVLSEWSGEEIKEMVKKNFN